MAVGAHLGFTDDQTNELFFFLRTAPELTYEKVRPSMAAAVLDHYLSTGKIDWAAA